MPGSLAQALSAARTLISKSTSFQNRRGVSEAAALQHIYLDSAEEVIQQGETLASKRPFAVVCADGHGYVQIGLGARIDLGGTGGVLVLFSDNPKSPEDHGASYLEFCDWISSVMDDVAQLPGRNTYWPFNKIDLVEPPFRPPLTERESDDYWVAAYVMSHHINGGG
jgi:hypothetical protein